MRTASGSVQRQVLVEKSKLKEGSMHWQVCVERSVVLVLLPMWSQRKQVPSGSRMELGRQVQV